MNSPQLRRILCACLLLLPARAFSAALITDIRAWSAPEYTRIVFDLSGPVQHRLFQLQNPARLVVDIDDADLRSDIPRFASGDPRVSQARSGRPSRGVLRMVFDIRRPVRARTHLLKPNEKFGHRLVIDICDPGGCEVTPVQKAAPPPQGKVLVAIDPGHGGEDTGAVGPRRLREKDAVLAIARQLDRLVAADPGMQSFLTRRGDYYVSLNNRTLMARNNHADLFVSIHADAFTRRDVRGSSVYALSQRGATSAQARILADRENAADLYGGESLNDKDDLLAKVLVDLAMTTTINQSMIFGRDVLAQLRGVGPIHIPQVEQAGFAVLKSPDIPSILVETAFISNPHEEAQLGDPAHQRRLAQAIFNGIRSCVSRGLQCTPVTQRAANHVVRPGDTLTAIARRYDVSVDALRETNQLRGDTLRVGQALVIPSGG